MVVGEAILLRQFSLLAPILQHNVLCFFISVMEFIGFSRLSFEFAHFASSFYVGLGIPDEFSTVRTTAYTPIGI
jgi:hypothetical protein